MTSFKRIAAPAALLLGLAIAGCKAEQTFTIYPDGSGKVVISNSIINPLMAQIFKNGGQMGGGEGEGEMPDPVARIKSSMAGRVYWTNLEAKDGPNGEYVVSGTGYFDNLNDVTPSTGGVSFQKNDDGGYVFEMKQDLAGPMKAVRERLAGMGGGMGGGDGVKPSPEAQVKQFLRMALTGSEVKITVVMPGAVKSAEGMKPMDGRKAQWRVGEDDIASMMGKSDGSEVPANMAMKVVCGEASGLDAELAAFKKELAAAKEASAEAPKAEPKKE